MIRKWGYQHFLHLNSNDLCIIINLKIKRFKKVLILYNNTENLVILRYHLGVHLSSRNIPSRKCASYPRVILNKINLNPNGFDCRRPSTNLPMGSSAQCTSVLLSHCLQSTIKSSAASHLENICWAHMRFVLCSKEPSCYLKSFVHSVSKKTYIKWSFNLLVMNGAKHKKWPEICFVIQ